MDPYSVFIQSTCVNVKFAYRSQGKFKVDGGKNQVYKYTGTIYRKGQEKEKFTRLTLEELKQKTQLTFSCLTTKKVPGRQETLTAVDGIGSKLSILSGDIEGMLE